MIEKLMAFNFKFHHIPGVENKIEDCISRLTRWIRETEHYSLFEPTLGNYAKVKRILNFFVVTEGVPMETISLQKL